MPMKQSPSAGFVSGVYGSSANQSQPSGSFNSIYANPQDISWNTNFQNNISPTSNLNNSGYTLPINGTYALPTNISSSPVHINDSSPQNQSNTLPAGSRQSQRPTLDPRIKRPRETPDDRDDGHETDAKDNAKAKS